MSAEKSQVATEVPVQGTTTFNYHLQSWRLGIVISSLCLGVFLLGLDVNIVSVAIPYITTQFQSLNAVSWYGSAYLMTVTAFQPGFGTLYKYFNAKVTYIASLLVFEVGSTVCAAAPSSNVLVFGRALLGVGAAGLAQGALAIIGYSVPLDKVPMYQGIVISAMGISVSVSPVIGGALTQYATWRWCFWINVPAGALVVLIVLVFVPFAESSNKSNSNKSFVEKLRHLDMIGLTLFLALICCILLALTWGGQKYGWGDSKIIGLFIGFGVLSMIFCIWQWKQGDFALIPPRVFLNRSICMGALALFGIYMAVNVYGYYFPIFFQSVQQVSIVDSGVRYLAFIVPQVVALATSGAVVTRWGYYVPYMIAGIAVSCVGGGLLTTIGIDTSTAKWASYLAVTGLGVGMCGQIPYMALQAVLDPTDVATGNAIAVFTSQFAGSLGIAIGQNILIRKLYEAVPVYTSAVTPAQVTSAGAIGLEALANGSSDILTALRHAYAIAVRQTLILPLAALCIAFPASCAMERLNIKVVTEQRKLAENRQGPTNEEEACSEHYK
ncbi:major facilitator superfamily domain-containing protein [Diaporthe sp. PMI_573]|nr:major facilitator superfamily domain-containing protein [Diaporthaceae sp. PMI_573]